MEDGSRTPVDRSGDLEQSHLLPPSEAGGRLLVLDPAAPRALEWAAAMLVEGRVVAFPTDTVYGLAASLAHPDALRRIFAIKGRPLNKPLPVLLASAGDLERVALDPDPPMVTLLARYWPGPLTAVVSAREGMPAAVTGPHHTVGARVPNHFLALELIQRAGGAIAAPSANRTGRTPATDAPAVIAQLGDEVDVILDGGTSPGGVASSVIAANGDQLTVLREGAIPSEHLIATWQEILRGERNG